jgi:hypothetical protein
MVMRMQNMLSRWRVYLLGVSLDHHIEGPQSQGTQDEGMAVVGAGPPHIAVA